VVPQTEVGTGCETAGRSSGYGRTGNGKERATQPDDTCMGRKSGRAKKPSTANGIDITGERGRTSELNGVVKRAGERACKRE